MQSAPLGPDQRKVPEGQGSRGPVGRSYVAPRRCGRPPIPIPFAVWADAPEASSPSRPLPFTPGEPPILLPARVFQILPRPGISIKWKLEYSVNEETSTSCYTHRLLWGGRYRPPSLRVSDEPPSHGKTSAVRSLRVNPSTRVSAPSVVRPLRPLVHHCPSCPQEPLPKLRCPADPRGCEEAPGDGGNYGGCSRSVPGPLGCRRDRMSLAMAVTVKALMCAGGNLLRGPGTGPWVFAQDYPQGPRGRGWGAEASSREAPCSLDGDSTSGAGVPPRWLPPSLQARPSARPSAAHGSAPRLICSGRSCTPGRGVGKCVLPEVVSSLICS